MAENHGSTLNVEKLINRFIRSRWICVVVAALFFLSGWSANADPVGDFFKKVGQSISKALQPPPAQQQTNKKQASVAGRPTSQKSNAAEATPSAPEQPLQPAKEEKFTPSVRRASAASAKEAKGDMPYGIPVPGRKGMVLSPYLPEGNYIDVSAFAPGTAVKDPYTGKIFLVP
ncbi:MAG: hypothetical protein DME33_14845 [Verrucomicrobia bacterium]|nr:MAG: hypothetical protein DME33_14845 [Verrucomicrobiota bacterium]